MTDFTALEFGEIWNAFRDFVSQNWSAARKRMSTYSDENMLFMSLSVLKHGRPRDSIAEPIETFS